MKRAWFDIHRWVGLKLSIVLSFILITGTFATVSYEIDWLLDSDRRVLPIYEPTVYDWQGMADAIHTARPDWAFTSINAPLDPWFASEALGVTPEGSRRRLLINPRTLEVQGEASWINAQRILRDSHRRLMISGRWGIALVASLSILLILSMISGLVIYKKFWRGFFKKPRTRDSRTLWGDLHRLGGLWGFWFVFIIALTALWYFIEILGLRPGSIPERNLEGLSIVENITPSTHLNDMRDTVHKVEPTFKITKVRFPTFAGDSIQFQGENTAILVRERANRFSFDPQTGELLSQVDATDYGVHRRISEMADPLHFGTFGGIWTKLLYFVFGCILSAMALSGVYIYSIRLRNAHEKQIARDAAKKAAAAKDRFLEAAE